MGNLHITHNPPTGKWNVGIGCSVFSFCEVNSNCTYSNMRKVLTWRKVSLFCLFFLLTYVFVITDLDNYKHVQQYKYDGTEKRRKQHSSRPLGNGIPKLIDVKKQAEQQSKRKEFIHNQCLQSPQQSIESIQDTIGSHVMINDKYKLMFCYIPKIGCTTWKRIFLVLSGFLNSTLDLKPGEVKAAFPNITTLKQLPAKEALEKLNTYTKITFVRHPFSRVLSAFRSKLRPGLKFDYTKQWRDNLGQYIMNQYRSKENITDNYDLSFSEFVRYLGDNAQRHHRYFNNNHFYSQYKTCLPCHVNYDYIGTMETFKDDAEYMLNTLVRDRFVELPIVSGTNSSSLRLQGDYYFKVPLDYLELLYKRYRDDFKMFGYSPNGFL
ncbi:carbohydrate sulfotransferase 11-like [Antedon mediterranea]|uniref:carbohydrate sulfotransferase 11-like n=1 Tax=Antedon mediterranea TaxID=105859 RepID=UPI003AF86B0E